MDSNKVVIQINYLGKKRNIKHSSQIDTVTEWHIKRIISVIIIFVIIIFIFFSLISNKVFDYQTNEPTFVKNSKKDINIEVKGVSDIEKNKPVQGIKKSFNPIQSIDKTIGDDEKRVEKNINSKVSIDKQIVRALLTSELIDKEPIDIITSPVTVNKINARKIYYFTEIIDMKGQVLYHYWLLNENVIFTRKINILGDRWRASTSKLIPYYKSGFWKVRLIDSESNILNEIQFKVIQK